MHLYRLQCFESASFVQCQWQWQCPAQAHCTKYGNSKRRERLQLTSKFHVLTFFSRSPLYLHHYARTDRSLTSIVVIPIYADTAWASSNSSEPWRRPPRV